jgi:hypothetical protein
VSRIASWIERPWLVLTLLTLPIAVALLRLRSPTWFPTGDLAQAELHARAVPGHFPLLGAAGRFGTIFEQGSHLGPAGAVLLSIPYRLAGANGWSLLFATAVLHIVAIAGVLMLARRTGGPRLMLAFGVALGAMIHSFGAAFFLEPWNPWFGVVVLLVAALCAWALWDGDMAVLPWFVIAVSVCAQVHVAYAPVVALLAVVVGVRIAVSPSARAALRGRLGVASTAIGLLVWLPPLIDQLTREPGNATVLWRHLVSPPEAPAGWRATTSTLVNELNLFGSWSTSVHSQPSATPTIGSWVGFVALWMLVALAVVIDHRRATPLLRCGWRVGATLVAASTATVLLVRGPVYDYLVRWLSSVTILVVVLVVLSIGDAVVPPHRRHAIGPAALGLVAVLVALAALATPVAPLERDSRLLAALAPASRELTSNDSDYLLRFHDPVALGALGIGLLADLEREGRRVVTDRWLSANVLPHRTVADIDAQTDDIIWVVTGDPAIERTRALPGAVVVAEADPRTPTEARRSDELRVGIEQALTEAGRTDLIARLDEQYGVSQVIAEPGLTADLVTDLEEYRALRLPAAVVLVPVEAPS